MLSHFNSFYQDTVYSSQRQDTLPGQSPVPSGNSNIVIPAAVPARVKQSDVQKSIVPLSSREQETDTSQNSFIPGEWNSSENFFTENGLKGVVNGYDGNLAKKTSYGTKDQPETMIPIVRNNFTYDWLLGIFLFLVVLFVWIRVFYAKFFAALASALISFQLSVKLFQERNVLSHRVSIVLDFIYVIVATIFLFELIEFSGFARRGMTGINLFLLLLNIIMLYAILRVVILRLTGSLFMVSPLFSEYIHNTFVVNKGLGIVLFPVVIMIHYLPYYLMPVMLVLGAVLFTLAFLFKSFRAYQIIIRRDILIFYLILYLCTLEILPLLLGYKFVTSLIQSN